MPFTDGRMAHITPKQKILAKHMDQKMLHNMRIITDVVMANLHLAQFLSLFHSKNVQNLISQQLWV